MDNDQLKKIIEGALLAAGRPLDLGRMEMLFEIGEAPPRDQIRAVLEDIEASCEGRGFELSQTGSGYRFQVRQELSSWINRLWEEKPQKYSRALLETLSLIAYRQPITRGDIEQIRGVSVSSQIIKTLLERDWVRVVGHRDVPGRPALYATAKQFLDHFNLRSLDELPPLSEIKDISDIDPELALGVEIEDDPESNSETLDEMLERNERETTTEDNDDEAEDSIKEGDDVDTSSAETASVETSLTENSLDHS